MEKRKRLLIDVCITAVVIGAAAVLGMLAGGAILDNII